MKNKGRYLSIDWGGKRVGIALSEPLCPIAMPKKVVIRSSSFDRSCQQIADEISSFFPLEGIILGLPLELSGKEGAASIEVRKLGAYLSEKWPAIPTYYIDERMTSKIASRGLKEQGISRKKRSHLEDAAAAALILQTFLDQPGP